MNEKSYKRILIIGCSGAGKSTLSVELANRLQLPALHLDALFWNEGWVPTSKPEFREKLQSELEKPAWIIDGNFNSTIEMRAQYADLIVFLDFPNWLCLMRVFKRRWMYRGKTRPDMAEGCPEKVDWEFVKFIWTYPKKKRPGVFQMLERSDAEVLILKSPREVENWLAALSKGDMD
ncbi:DNA topology modulation protein [Sporosarcina luteola]|uniref:DNA topology modulation protein n=1 Tax=Sporosarcina luteola TaxID=582850 RepID=UPI0020406059|nr:DNA topology modulation protein [Sporosarcina luteola]MCM3638363.1 DNA topology modulation protein [Sporosarcina luteola]